MTRQIKFRAWTGVVMLDDVSFDASSGSANGQGVTYLQFTGLLDKTGKEIYEGDLLSYIAKERNQHQVAGEVEFNKGQFLVKGSQLSLAGDVSNYGVEIIGNIYSNPELLEKS